MRPPLKLTFEEASGMLAEDGMQLERTESGGWVLTYATFFGNIARSPEYVTWTGATSEGLERPVIAVES